jgi:hypothetical protein
VSVMPVRIMNIHIYFIVCFPGECEQKGRG